MGGVQDRPCPDASDECRIDEASDTSPMVSKKWSRSGGTSPVNSAGMAGSKSGAKRDWPTSDLERRITLRGGFVSGSGSVTSGWLSAEGSSPLSSHGGNCHIWLVWNHIFMRDLWWIQDGFKMDSKWIQNEFKMDSKWIQNEFKMDSKWTQNEFKMDSRWIQDGFKMDSRWIQDGFKMDWWWILWGHLN